VARPLRTLIVPIAALLLSGCHATHDDGVHSLAGLWAFHPGDDPRWAAPGFDDSSWARLQVPLSWGVQGYQDVFGIAWYRIRVNRTWPSDQPLGVTIGKIDAAYELYVDGVKLGGSGHLPPQPREDYDRHVTFVLPHTGTFRPITFALRVWRPPARHPGEAGPTSGPFEIGPLPAVIERANVSEVDRLVLSCIFLVAALYMFGLWLLRPKSPEYAWFAAVAVVVGVYSFLLTQWKYALFSDFMAMKKTEHILLHITPILLFQFVWAFLGRPQPRWLRGLQMVFGAGALAVALSPGLEVALFLLPILEIVAAGAAFVCLGCLGYWAYRGDRDAVSVGVGILALTIAMTRDTLIDRGAIVGPTCATYGFTVMVVGLALSLAIRFHNAVEGLDAMSRELEGRVRKRTAELAEAYRRMEDLALRDPLTNLLNRRSIVERASAGLALACRRRSPYGVALIDVDRFKAINDTYGHATGDRVLLAIAQTLASETRISDDAARWGGEEFLVLLPDSDGPAAWLVCERLRSAIEEISVCDDEGEPIRVTASVGVASVESWDDGSALFDDLMRRADYALYAAKQDGRNRIRADVRGRETTGARALD
jgi:diguanylate cyclase (GGDEF)-like protein